LESIYSEMRHFDWKSTQIFECPEHF